MKGYYSDIVIKTRLKSEKKSSKQKGKKTDEVPAEIYILFEHKSYQDRNIYFQLLKYMYMMWERDYREKREFRVIIPLVFYHGKSKWRLNRKFNSIFRVKEELKKYLLNYEYLLFDTNEWDMEDERNRGIKNNVFLLSALLLMKSAYNNDIESIERVFDIWRDTGIIDKETIITFLYYIVSTKEIKEKELIKIIEENKIGGEDIMPTLARKWYEEGREEGINVGFKEGIEKGIERGIEKGIERGEYERAKKDAKNLLMMGVEMDIIVKATGLSEREVEEIKKGIRKN